MSTPEIRRGDFVYHDTLFVDVGNGRRHPRASAADLKDLLLPKQGKAPAKDQVAHWYEAQLIHYGLQRTKDKNTAKVRLTGAVSAKSLAVPQYISQMEADMKKEYASAMRKAKTTQSKTGVTAKGKKRPAEDDLGDRGPTLSFKADGIEFAYSPGNAASNKKTKTKTKTKPATKIPASDASSSPSRPTTNKPTTPARPKQTARRSRPFNYPGPSSRPTQQSPRRLYDHTPSSFSTIDLSSDEDDDDAPPPYTSRSVSPSSPRSNTTTTPLQISGTYPLTATGVNTLKHYDPSFLTLALHHPSNTLWGVFRIGPKRGLIRLPSTNLHNRETNTFAWRAEDVFRHEMRFGRGCEGRIVFDGEGGVSGVMCGVMYGGDVEFEGTRRDGDGDGDGDGDERVDLAVVKGDWDGFPDRAYGRV